MQTVSINIDGENYSKVAGSILQSGQVQDCNTFEKPDLIQPKVFYGAKLSGNNLEIILPPFSVVVLEVK